MNTLAGLFLVSLVRYVTHGCDTFPPSPYDMQNTSYFYQAVHSGCFVDKTMLLKAFVECAPKKRHVLVTSPANFGKSTNLDMIRRFFSVTFSRITKRRINRKTTYYYRLFTNSSFNFAITQHADFIQQHFGEYFVFYLSFGDIEGKTAKQIVNSIKQLIKDVLTNHIWLYKIMKDKLDYKRKAMVNRYLLAFRKVLEFGATEEATIRGFTTLFVFYTLHAERKLMVLIDDYDAPIRRAISYGVPVSGINTFMQSILGVLFNVTTEYEISHTMIAGQSRWFKDDYTSVIADAVDFRYFLHEHEFSEYFGFTESQVHGVLADDTRRPKIAELFNGYRIEKSTVPIYHPKGVAQHLLNRTELDPSPEYDMMPKLMKCLQHRVFLQNILQLYATKSIARFVHFHMCSNDLDRFAEIAQKNCSTMDPQTPYVTLFLDHGYLTPTGQPNIYKIPNRLIDGKFRRDLSLYYHDTYGVTILDSRVASSIRTIFHDQNTADETVRNFENSLNSLLQPNASRNLTLDKFQLQSILFAAVFCNADITGDVDLTEINKSTKSKFLLDTIAFTDHHRKTLIVVQLTFKKTLKDAIQRAQRYTPFGPPKSSSFKLIKTFGVNFNQKNKLEIGSGEIRRH